MMNTDFARSIAAASIAALLLPACATRPENVVASHVSSSRYAERTCKSLGRELDEVQDALRAQSGKLNDKATQDAVVTGVGVILFWPVLFALGNNAGLEGDVARLKGEEQAIRKSMREQECEPPAPKPAPAVGATAGVGAPASATGASTAQAPAAGAPGVTNAGAGPVVSAAPLPPPASGSGSGSMLPVPARRGEGMQ